MYINILQDKKPGAKQKDKILLPGCVLWADSRPERFVYYFCVITLGVVLLHKLPLKPVSLLNET